MTTNETATGNDSVASTGKAWDLTGNAGTNPATDFLGTTDGKPLIIQPGTGNIGIGTTEPASRLVVAGTSDYGVTEIIGNGPNAEASIGFRASNVAKGETGNWVLGVNGSWEPTGAFSLYSSSTGQVISVFRYRTENMS
jgi:hypothetical protein